MIEVSHLTKQYGNHPAVTDLSFKIEKGRIYGFLGPNGAGKSSTLNMITGCLAATSGEIKIGGYDIFEEAEQAKKLIGYLPEQPPLYLDRTPKEYLEFVAEAKKVPKSERRKQIAKVIERTQIADVSDRLIKNLSKGYKQRVGIAQALLGEPDIIILDEPTVGLDPKQIVEIRSLIRDLGREHTVLLSSHILSEVQSVCNNVLILAKGSLVASGTPEDLENLFTEKSSVELFVEAGKTEIQKILNGLEKCEIKIEPQGGENCRVCVETTEGDRNLCRELFFLFADAKLPIVQMNRSRRSLEDIFIELTSEDETAEEVKE